MARVLLVEDDPDLLFALQEIVRMGGHEVQGARNGREAQRLLIEASFQPQAVICDFQMPEMNGDALLKWMRETPAVADTVFVMMSGRAQDQRVAMALGADDYLPKPFEIYRLDQILQAHLPDPSHSTAG